MDELIYQFDQEKNAKLKEERGISFEDVIYCIDQDYVLDIVPHPNQADYPDQKIVIVAINEYAYQVPIEIREGEVRLITIFPSRKATKHYLESNDE